MSLLNRLNITYHKLGFIHTMIASIYSAILTIFCGWWIIFMLNCCGVGKMLSWWFGSMSWDWILVRLVWEITISGDCLDFWISCRRVVLLVSVGNRLNLRIGQIYSCSYLVWFTAHQERSYCQTIQTDFLHHLRNYFCVQTTEI